MEIEGRGICIDQLLLAVQGCRRLPASIRQWLPKDDSININVAELEAVIKGLNLGVKWGLCRSRVLTDSATVYGWVRSVLGDGKRPRPRVSGLEEMLIRRRLNLISELVEVHSLHIDLQLMKSAHNLADELTREPKKWLSIENDPIWPLERPTRQRYYEHCMIPTTWVLTEHCTVLGTGEARRLT